MQANFEKQIFIDYNPEEFLKEVKQLESKINGFLAFAEKCPNDSFIFIDDQRNYQCFTPYSSAIAQMTRAAAEQPGSLGWLVGSLAGSSINAADNAMQKTIQTVEHIARQALNYSETINLYIGYLNQLDDLVQIGAMRGKIQNFLEMFEELKQKFQKMTPLFRCRSPEKAAKYQEVLSNLFHQVDQANSRVMEGFDRRKEAIIQIERL